MLKVAIKEMKGYFRSPVAVFMTVFFPCLLIYVLGTMLQSLDISDHSIGDIKIQYNLSDTDKYNAEAFESFITGIDMVKAEETHDKENALSLADKGEINAYIELHGSDIKMFTGDNDTINRALKSMLGSYNTMADTYKNIAMVNPSALQEVISKDISEMSYVEQNGLGVTRSMIDYYAVSVIVMMIFMSGITGQSEVFKEEKNANTYSRLLLTTTPKLSVFFGKVIGSIPMSVITVGATMIFAVVFFGANYCSDILGNILLVVMLLSVSLAATALGTVAGLIMKIPAASVLMPICWQMLFFSGTFSKEIFIEGYSTSLPPYLIQQAAFDLTLFGDGSGAIVVTLVSLAIFVILTIIGAAVFAKKKAV